MANITVTEMEQWTKADSAFNLFYHEDIINALIESGVPKEKAIELINSGVIRKTDDECAVGLFIMGQCVCWVSAVQLPGLNPGEFKYKCLL